MKPINSLVALLDIGNIFGGVAERENAHTLLEIIEKQKEEQKIKELALSQKIAKEEASWRYYKSRAFKSIFETPQFYNMKHVKYLNHEEYRLFKIPFQTGNKRTSAHVEYEEIGGVEYNKATKKERTKESKEHSSSHL